MPAASKTPATERQILVLDPTASLVQVSSTPSLRTRIGESPQPHADPLPPIGLRPLPLTSASISWTARPRRRPFRLLTR